MKKLLFLFLFLFLFLNQVSFADSIDGRKIYFDDSPEVNIIRQSSLKDIITVPQTDEIHSIMTQDETMSDTLERKALTKFLNYKNASNFKKDYGYDVDENFVQKILENKNVVSLSIKSREDLPKLTCFIPSKSIEVTPVLMEVRWMYPENSISVVERILFGVQSRNFQHPFTNSIQCVNEITMYVYRGDINHIPDSNNLLHTNLIPQESNFDYFKSEIIDKINNKSKDGVEIFVNDTNYRIVGFAVSLIGDIENTTNTQKKNTSIFSDIHSKINENASHSISIPQNYPYTLGDGCVGLVVKDDAQPGNWFPITRGEYINQLDADTSDSNGNPLTFSVHGGGVYNAQNIKLMNCQIVPHKKTTEYDPGYNLVLIENNNNTGENVYRNVLNKLMSIPGMDSADGSNAALKYAESPESECGIVVSSLINGDTQKLNEITEGTICK